MNFVRTMAGAKPYGLLQNSDFDAWGPYVERYFQVAMFYGVYPSFFSADASSNRYWDNPAWYNRDRPLFVRYVPLIQALGRAGWEPVTLATTGDPNIWVERYGSADDDDLHLTVRNVTTWPLTPTLTMDAAALGLVPTSVTDLLDSRSLSYTWAAGQVTFPAPLAAGETRVYRIGACVLPGDVIRDGRVTAADVQTAANAWRSRRGEPGHNQRADADGDGWVSAADVMTSAHGWGTVCSFSRSRLARRGAGDDRRKLEPCRPA
jgi:hypothetical protein